MNATLAAITAAGVVYNAADFSDPKLDGPTALTVTADGRVFGHLAQWGTCHIGFGQQCVQPPTSAQGYKYFHQGVVDTDAGPMPVGKITLGTGHAPVDGHTDAVMAAAHYDNTGTVVATVRAGEDEHGIWLAGRLVPGLDDAKVDELRRSGVSGDWRGIDNHHELVAALAVNVPGFPVPRTEQLVASGGVAALVAAGIVLRPEDLMPKTPAELRAVIAAAVADDDRKKKRDALAARVKEAADGQLDDRRGKASKKVQDARKARAFDKAMTAAAGTDDMKAAPLRRYWTKGKGLARWSGSPHPYTTLVKNLESEIKTGMTPQQIKGLAANYFHAVFGIWPGERKGENPVGPGSGAMVAAALARVAALDADPKA